MSALWLWTMAAPAARQRIPSAAISAGERGTWGFCSGVVTPLTAASMITGVGMAGGGFYPRDVRAGKGRMANRMADSRIGRGMPIVHGPGPPGQGFPPAAAGPGKGNGGPRAPPVRDAGDAARPADPRPVGQADRWSRHAPRRPARPGAPYPRRPERPRGGWGAARGLADGAAARRGAGCPRGALWECAACRPARRGLRGGRAPSREAGGADRRGRGAGDGGVSEPTTAPGPEALRRQLTRLKALPTLPKSLDAVARA